MLDSLFDLLLLFGLGIGLAVLGFFAFDRIHRGQMKELEKERKDSKE